MKWNKRDSFQKIQLMTICYWTHVRHEGEVFKKMKTIYYSMLFNLCAYWNETRGSFQKQQKKQFITVCYSTCVLKKTTKKTIYYSMLFNLCAYWNETRGTVFKKTKKHNLLQYAIQLVCILKWNKRGSFQKNNNLLQYAIQLVCVLKWNKRESFQKNNNLLMLYNLCAYWNETKGLFLKKQQKKQFITVCYSTCVHSEMKQERQFSKKSNWWQYATEHMCDMKGQFSKNNKKNNLLQYAIQLVCILKWNKEQFLKKIQLMTICYWTHVRNETSGAVFKKQQFITVCYSTCVCIEMKQEGKFSKKQQFITACYTTCVRIEMKQ